MNASSYCLSFLCLGLAACSSTDAGDDSPTEWIVVSDTVMTYPDLPVGTDNTVTITTLAKDRDELSTLTFTCRFRYGNAIANGLAISRKVSIQDNEPFLQTPAVHASWIPTSAADPANTWTPFAYTTVELDPASTPAFMASFPGKTSLEVSWLATGNAVTMTRTFDVRQLAEAITILESRCHR